MALPDGRAAVAMRPLGSGRWVEAAPLGAGLNHIVVEAETGADRVDVLVRAVDALPKRGPAGASGEASKAIGARPEADILGIQIGPTRNGGEPS